ncbi:hypothetical protein AB4Y85_15305 [Microvirga sp. 2YAF29]|uniref:hypothetical protein n=1 Tax=Microvirga sp. 2YAF29 TaxID=3233031 RepID=UPI003F95C777
MIIALMALAFAMIVGGLLAAFFGWDIVLIERGWTMVIAGSFTAASGALLLGITAVVSRLSQIQSEIARLQLSLDEEAAVDAPVGPTGMSMAALSGGLLAGKMFGRGETKDAQEIQDEQKDLPLFDDDKPEVVEVARYPEEPAPSQPREPFMPFPPRTSPEVSESEEDAPEVKVPDFLLGDRLRETYMESRTPETDIDLYEDQAEKAPEEKSDVEEREEIVVSVVESAVAVEPAEPDEPAAIPEPEREPEPVLDAAAPEEPASEPEEQAPAEPRPATIIGTYNSGDNTYVMFSDGSIEAQTPSGIFHFQSLDELKAFIASGGEGGGTASI